MLAVGKHCFHTLRCREIRPGKQTISKHGRPGKVYGFGTGIKKEKEKKKEVADWLHKPDMTKDT